MTSLSGLHNLLLFENNFIGMPACSAYGCTVKHYSISLIFGVILKNAKFYLNFYRLL